MNRYDSQAARLLARKPAADTITRKLALTGIGAAVALISGVSLFGQVASQAPAGAGGCAQNWPYIDAGCRGGASPSAEVAVRPIRVIGLDRNAPAIVAKAVQPAAAAHVAAVQPATIPLAAAGTAKTEPVTEPIAASVTPAPSTDGSGQFAAPTTRDEVTASPAVPPIQFTEQDLTFKAGAVHRRAAVAKSGDKSADKSADAADATADRHEAAPARRKVVRATKRHERRQVYELPDGRRVTVFRRYAGEQAAGNGGFFGEPFGGRRDPPGVSGLY